MSQISYSPEQKQENLNHQTAETIEKHGGVNYLQGEYFAELSKYVIGSSNELFSDFQPNISIPELSKDSYIKAFKISVAFLLRYHLNLTYQTLKTEFADLPTHSSFKRGSELDAYFDALINHKPLPQLEPPKRKIKTTIIRKVVKTKAKRANSNANSMKNSFQDEE